MASQRMLLAVALDQHLVGAPADSSGTSSNNRHGTYPAVSISCFRVTQSSVDMG